MTRWTDNDWFCLDMTFCGSPGCKGKCGRSMNEKQKAYAHDHPNFPIAYSYFCSDEGELLTNEESQKMFIERRDETPEHLRGRVLNSTLVSDGSGT